MVIVGPVISNPGKGKAGDSLEPGKFKFNFELECRGATQKKHVPMFTNKRPDYSAES